MYIIHVSEMLIFRAILPISQSQAQPDIDHTLMSEKYPRYSSVFDVNVSEHEKAMLMVRGNNIYLVSYDTE